MVKCTKEWTESEQALLRDAIGILRAGDSGYVCNAVEYAATRLNGHGHYLQEPFAPSHWDVAARSIKKFISDLLGPRTTLCAWMAVDRSMYDNSPYTPENQTRRIRWIEWMLGEREADGSEFPVEEA
jgi:hypothetical protein